MLTESTTPPLTIGLGIYIKDGKVLLIRRPADSGDYAGQLAIPGGKKEKNESIYSAAMREFQEETGNRFPSFGEYVGHISEILHKKDGTKKYFDIYLFTVYGDNYDFNGSDAGEITHQCMRSVSSMNDIIPSDKVILSKISGSCQCSSDIQPIGSWNSVLYEDGADPSISQISMELPNYKDILLGQVYSEAKMLLPYLKGYPGGSGLSEKALLFAAHYNSVVGLLDPNEKQGLRSHIEQCAEDAANYKSADCSDCGYKLSEFMLSGIGSKNNHPASAKKFLFSSRGIRGSS